MIRPLALALTAVGLLAACEPMPNANVPQTTGSIGGVPLGDFYLVSLGSEAVPQRDSTLTLTGNGFSGRGPCNTFTGVNAATLPAFQVTTMNWTDLQCPGKAFEDRYFAALTQATEIEYSGGVLVVKGPTYMQLEPGVPAGPLSRLGR